MMADVGFALVPTIAGDPIGTRSGDSCCTERVCGPPPAGPPRIVRGEPLHAMLRGGPNAIAGSSMRAEPSGPSCATAPSPPRLDPPFEPGTYPAPLPTSPGP